MENMGTATFSKMAEVGLKYKGTYTTSVISHYGRKRKLSYPNPNYAAQISKGWHFKGRGEVGFRN